MRDILIAGVLTLLVGCQNVVGPFQPRSPRRVDDPSLPTWEQERRGRAQLPLPQESPLAVPPLNTPTPDGPLTDERR